MLAPLSAIRKDFDILNTYIGKDSTNRKDLMYYILENIKIDDPIGVRKKNHRDLILNNKNIFGYLAKELNFMHNQVKGTTLLNSIYSYYNASLNWNNPGNLDPRVSYDQYKDYNYNSTPNLPLPNQYDKTIYENLYYIFAVICNWKKDISVPTKRLLAFLKPDDYYNVFDNDINNKVLFKNYTLEFIQEYKNEIQLIEMCINIVDNYLRSGDNEKECDHVIEILKELKTLFQNILSKKKPKQYEIIKDIINPLHYKTHKGSPLITF
jgi:hypothetical protein